MSTGTIEHQPSGVGRIDPIDRLLADVERIPYSLRIAADDGGYVASIHNREGVCRFTVAGATKDGVLRAAEEWIGNPGYFTALDNQDAAGAMMEGDRYE